MEPIIKVSVIIPVYNGGALFKNCLDSLLAQTLTETEIICVDDGSTDDTPRILADYAAKDSRILPLHQENAGAARARNFGLTHARGDYVLFLDADDFFEPAMLQKTYARALECTSDIVLFRGDRYDHQKKAFLPMDYALRRELLPDQPIFSWRDLPDHIFNFVVGWAWDKLYRRSFLLKQDLAFQEIRTSNDLFFTFSSLVKAQRICTEDTRLIHHRIQVKNSLSVTRERSWNCFYLASRALYEELHRLKIYPAVELSFVNWVLHFSFWNLDTIGEPYRSKVYDLIRQEILPMVDISKFSREDIRQTGFYDRIQDMRKGRGIHSPQVLSKNRRWKETAKRMAKKMKRLLARPLHSG